MSKRLNCFSDFSSKEPFLVHSDTSLELELQNLLLKSFGGISEVGADGGQPNPGAQHKALPQEAKFGKLVPI